jgi:hypothetical protein
MSIVISGSTGINTVSQNIISSIATEVTTAALPQMFAEVASSVSTELGNITTGTVLQVVSTLSATQAYQAANATDAQLGELTHTITPLGNNSKFLVTVRWFGEAASGWDICFNIHQDGVRVNSAGGRGTGLYMPTLSYFNDNNSTPEIAHFSTLVDTSSIIGTPITYTAVVDANGSLGVWTNRTFGTPAGNFEVGTSEIIVMEIAA